MAAKKQNRLTPAEQSARFKETARKLGADERPEEFDKVLKTVARPKKPASGRKV
jgi:hypothetical protein